MTLHDDPTLEPRREIEDRVTETFDLQIRPTLQAEGSDAELVGVDSDNIVQIRLIGACQGCSSSIHALTMSIERDLKAAVPEIRFVEAVL
jgi:Fe-S cluster biogenesis protein NfuA